MACGQVTCDGDLVKILCDEDWTCCQREQAKAKTEAYKADQPLKLRPTPTPAAKATVMAEKAACQKADGDKMIKSMPGGADQWATSPCLADQMKKDWAAGKKGVDPLGVQMDHPVDWKVGGATVQPLKALDKKINNFFGTTVAKAQGDKMIADGKTHMKKVELVCKPPCTPPHNAATTDFSTNKRTVYPASPEAALTSPKRALA